MPISWVQYPGVFLTSFLAVQTLSGSREGSSDWIPGSVVGALALVLDRS